MYLYAKSHVSGSPEHSLKGAATTASTSMAEIHTTVTMPFHESTRSASPGTQLEARTRRSILSHIRRAESPSAFGSPECESDTDPALRQEELERRHKIALVLRRMILRKVSRAFQTWTNFVRVIFLHTYMKKGIVNVSVDVIKECK